MKVIYVILLSIISLFGFLSGCDLGGQDSREIAASKGIVSDQRLFFVPFTDGRRGAPGEEFNSRPKEFVVLKGKHIYPQELGGVDYLESEDPLRYLEGQYSLTDSILLIKNDSSEKMVFINPEIDDSLNFKSQFQIHIWNVENWRTEKEGIFYEISQEDFDEYGVNL